MNNIATFCLLLNPTITNGPAGYRGFYTLGISAYIKHNYNLSNHRYIGASAGAGNSLFLSFNGNDSEYITGLLERVDALVDPSLPRILEEMQTYHTDRYTVTDFDLDRLTVKVQGVQSGCNIYSNFCTLNDAVNCVKASCNVPFITGSLFNRYLGELTYDGGFCDNPAVGDENFHVAPWMWEEATEYTLFGFLSVPRFACRLYDELFLSQKYKSKELFEKGWEAAAAHRSELDGVFS